jgi:hypothetical protein
VAHERVHFGASAFAPVNEADTARHQVTIGNLPADTNEKGNPGLNLMPIRKPLNSDVRYSQRKLFSLTHAQANAFIDDGAIALGSAKGVAQPVGGIQHVIEQAYFPKVRIARQMKSEKIILQCIRDQADKFDLAFRGPNVFYFDLPPRYTSLTINGATSIPAALARTEASRDSVPSALGRLLIRWRTGGRLLCWTTSGQEFLTESLLVFCP